MPLTKCSALGKKGAAYFSCSTRLCHGDSCSVLLSSLLCLWIIWLVLHTLTYLVVPHLPFCSTSRHYWLCHRCSSNCSWSAVSVVLIDSGGMWPCAFTAILYLSTISHYIIIHTSTPLPLRGKNICLTLYLCDSFSKVVTLCWFRNY